jgi:hypothetical protein
VVLVGEAVKDGFSIDSELGEDWSLAQAGRQYCPVAGDADGPDAVWIAVRPCGATVVVGGHDVRHQHLALSPCHPVTARREAEDRSGWHVDDLE